MDAPTRLKLFEIATSLYTAKTDLVIGPYKNVPEDLADVEQIKKTIQHTYQLVKDTYERISKT